MLLSHRATFHCSENLHAVWPLKATGLHIRVFTFQTGNSDLIWANNEQPDCSYRAAYRNTSVAITPVDWMLRDVLGTVGSHEVHINVFLWCHQAWIHTDQQGQKIIQTVGTEQKTCTGCPNQRETENFPSVSHPFFRLKLSYKRNHTFRTELSTARLS